MFSYLRELISTIQDVDWARRQAILDTRLRRLAQTNQCNDVLLEYLFYVREHGRNQRERFASLNSFRDYLTNMERVKEENNVVLNDLEDALLNSESVIDTCARIREITKK